MKRNIGFYKIVYSRLKRDRRALLGLLILFIIIAFAFLGPFLSKYGEDYINYSNIKSAPSVEHILGTDKVGRDVLTRLMYGGRISIMIGIFSVLLQAIMAVILGIVSGYYGGMLDTLIMRFTDVVMSIPVLPILIVLGAIFSDMKISDKERIFLIVAILSILQWPSLARIVRGEVLKLKNKEFMLAADILGISDRRKMFSHIFPNVLPQIIVFSTLSVGGNIMMESTLSFLGLGITEPSASWGNMIQVVGDFYTFDHYPWLWIPPGICIFLTVMSINLLGDSLREAVDTK
ncbi:peptide/nickel transport system permease protein [Clostridium acetobutylicum]|uniref:Oligopeptide ABC-type transporter, permease component OPPC n=1 Tax=Clostridium acetobutylicum (strain ATCC 824 / DSM 792 / JCM 1419 / IAM 19013 / LMG 5710 / NBRC 13948 / NRRL B-527 / VKM B-1787 / 2291 / W) TaxID=272562 RepID=Q97GJ2_CLOAB|nr:MULTISPECIES: ABC transporter permease [Clostridium]AAK80330.1 Oligopeptide ABC-type transporter, permease component OPPC [Clostridium acetobutylicum ATCC 824]ADZ21426.1 Oligopeptide ABC-type transporter, permease component OPPC [Clostridium acetobutylicum EA 2018]AEI34695.1 oligopeptide ABC transporter, permease component [Clostridium acetobutylicum DSM 1731]AWV79248.1 ABC transporter permease [Clostridium acetobutylicum]MBC2394783.1 ABC transporter permease [Clostridium acetobutylicum]